MDRRDFLFKTSALAAGLPLAGAFAGCASLSTSEASLILRNGKIHTLDSRNSVVSSIAVKDGKVLAVGNDADLAKLQGTGTRVIDLAGRVVVPGLNDSHMHLINGGLQYNLEVRWDDVPSVADALRILCEQAERTQPGQWVRVLGSWSEFQFAERRMPTLEEVNAVSKDVPVMILHSTTQPCSIRPQCRLSATPATRRNRPVAKSSRMPRATRLV